MFETKPRNATSTRAAAARMVAVCWGEDLGHKSTQRRLRGQDPQMSNSFGRKHRQLAKNAGVDGDGNGHRLQQLRYLDGMAGGTNGL